MSLATSGVGLGANHEKFTPLRFLSATSRVELAAFCRSLDISRYLARMSLRPNLTDVLQSKSMLKKRMTQNDHLRHTQKVTNRNIGENAISFSYGTFSGSSSLNTVDIKWFYKGKSQSLSPLSCHQSTDIPNYYFLYLEINAIIC